MELCHTEPGKKTADINVMLRECEHHFGKLYAQQDGNTPPDMFAKLEPLESTGSGMCEGPISETELANALADMKTSASPGPDGFTVPFFKCF